MKIKNAILSFGLVLGLSSTALAVDQDPVSMYGFEMITPICSCKRGTQVRTYEDFTQKSQCCALQVNNWICKWWDGGEPVVWESCP